MLTKLYPVVEKPEREGPCKRLERRSEDNIKMDLREMRCVWNGFICRFH
jgi:hypothetical protein